MISTKKQTLIALLYFFIASSLGIILRIFPIADVDATYKFILHTHSHIALLGWVYIALVTLIYHLFIKQEFKKKYNLIFLCTQITIVGMLISFPITGYALYSIIFSTLFLICSYWFYYFFKKYNNCNTKSHSYKLINTSLLFMIVSSLGPWALGIIMNTLGSTSHWYKNAIYFYLHFQYNGWFLFCLLGFFFYALEKENLTISRKKYSSLYVMLVISCCLTLFLSFLWMNPSKIIFVLATVGAIFQIFVVLKLHKIMNSLKIRKVFSPLLVNILKFVYCLFIVKVILQLLTSSNYFSELTTQIVDFVIGYLHLTFLGIVSLSLFVFLVHFKLLTLSKFWLKIYVVGFITSELLIFYKGFCTWKQLPILNNYFLFLVIFSSLIPISIFGFLKVNFSK